jgi:dGTP triphosphohydrolase
MAVHKYYVAVFQLDYVPAKKIVQMTSRVFIDDLEAAFVKKYKKKFYLGTSAEVADANEYLKKYFTEKVYVKINNKEKAIKFLGKEIEDDVIICYYTFPAEHAVKSLEISNTTLFELFENQENIIHTNINRNKKSLLLTNEEPKGLFEF